jgi:hypothetical protein
VHQTQRAQSRAAARRILVGWSLGAASETDVSPSAFGKLPRAEARIFAQTRKAKDKACRDKCRVDSDYDFFGKRLRLAMRQRRMGVTPEDGRLNGFAVLCVRLLE